MIWFWFSFDHYNDIGGKNCKHFTINTFTQVFFIAESDYEDDLDDFSSNDDDDNDDDDDYDGEDSDFDDGKKKSKSKAKKTVKSPKATKGKTNSTKTTKPAAASSKAASKSGDNAKTLFLRFVLHTHKTKYIFKVDVWIQQEWKFSFSWLNKNHHMNSQVWCNIMKFIVHI